MEFKVVYHLSILLSKNKLMKFGKGRYYIPRNVLDERDRLFFAMKKAGKGKVFKPREKVWLEIMVYRKDFRFDPINFIDSIADVAKKVVMVDDRFFSCKCDWEIDFKKPRIEITIKQGESIEELSVASNG